MTETLKLYNEPIKARAKNPDGKWVDVRVTALVLKEGRPVAYRVASEDQEWRVSAGGLLKERVVIIWKDMELEINDYGMIPGWPEGFCDLESRVAERLLRLAVEKRKRR